MFTLSRRILISAPKESVRQYLQELPNADSGFVEVSGKMLGVRWHGAFKASFTEDGGYRAEMVRGPLPHVVRDIQLRPVLGGTMVTHLEHYSFPSLLWPLAYVLRKRLERNLDKELGVIKEGAERLHRRLQIEAIDP